MRRRTRELENDWGRVERTLKSFCVGSALVILTAACSRGTGGGPPSSAPAGSDGAVSITAVPVKSREVQRTIEVVGTLLAGDEVTVSSEVDGPVETVLVDRGDRVAAGQLLVRVSPEEYRFRLASERGALRQALAKLGLTEEELTPPAPSRSGVNEAFRVDEARIPDVKKGEADLYEAEQKFKRIEQLLKDEVASKQDFDQAQSRYLAAKANLESIRDLVKSLTAQLRQLQASVQLAEKKLADTEIRAPFGGFVKERLVTKGQYLKVQNPIVSLVNVNPLRLTVDVPERFIPLVEAGEPVQVRVDAYPNETFTGKVFRISPSVNEQTRSLTVEVHVLNDRERLKPGLFARGAILSNRRETVLQIPAGAVINFFGINKVYVVDQGKIREQEVQVGDRLGESFEVTQGLKEGETVALSNLGKLKNGTPVAVEERGRASGVGGRTE